MSRAISPSSSKPYGLERVCSVWRVSRATVYRRRRPPSPLRLVGKRGPNTQVSDEELLALIREDLATTEWWVRPFRNVEELRLALLEWAARYNSSWLIERHGFLTPIQAREAYEMAARAA